MAARRRPGLAAYRKRLISELGGDDRSTGRYRAVDLSYGYDRFAMRGIERKVAKRAAQLDAAHERGKERRRERRAQAGEQRRTRAAYKRAQKSLRRWEKRRQARDAKLSRTYKILQDTGVLVGSIQPDWGPNHVAAFTDVPYANFHVSPAPRRKIPLRDFFAVDQERVSDDIADILLAEIMK